MAELRSRPSMHGRCWHTMPALTRFALRVDPYQAAPALAGAPGEAVPLSLTACRSELRGDWAALWLGPDEQLLVGPDGAADTCAARVHEALRSVPHSLVDISHRQAAIALAGPYAADLLNTGCPLDLESGAFPIGACTRTVFAKSEVVLWRRGHQQFHLEAWRSFVPYVAGLLSQAEGEF